MRTAVASASGRADDAIKWVKVAEKKEITHADLADSGHEFNSIDIKLASALQNIAKGALSRKLTMASEKEMMKIDV